MISLPSRPLLALADYQRIVRVIHSVLDSVDADIPAASFFFGLTASHILKQFYKKAAYPVAGAAFYQLNAAGQALSFGTLEKGAAASHRDAFHCWVQCDGWIIDFMAPVFRELLAASGHAMPVPRLMFQKELSRMSPSPSALHAPGDFRLEPNLQLTRELLQQFMGKAALSNLSRVCLEWYRKPPKPLTDDLVMRNAQDESTSIHLSRLQIDGAW